jgi:hypothetical protein
MVTEQITPIAPSTSYTAKVRGPVRDTDRADAHAANSCATSPWLIGGPSGVRKVSNACRPVGRNIFGVRSEPAQFRATAAAAIAQIATAPNGSAIATLSVVRSASHPTTPGPLKIAR